MGLRKKQNTAITHVSKMDNEAYSSVFAGFTDQKPSP
uniref:Uncharacterized protein n=1 Tax=Anguilla anguilla TaxID=7936 RepID=A0A0E9TCV2_ANGAN